MQTGELSKQNRCSGFHPSYQLLLACELGRCFSNWSLTKCEAQTLIYVTLSLHLVGDFPNKTPSFKYFCTKSRYGCY